MTTTTQTKQSVGTAKPGRVWLVLLAGPLLFLLGIVLASIYFGVATQGDVAAIPGLVAASTPYQLVVIQILLFFILRWAMKRDGLAWRDIGWRTAGGQQAWREALVGAVPGAGLGLLYVFVLSPWLTSPAIAGRLRPRRRAAAGLRRGRSPLLYRQRPSGAIRRGEYLSRLCPDTLVRAFQPAGCHLALVLLLWPAALGRWFLVHLADRPGGRRSLRLALHEAQEHHCPLCSAPGAEYRGISFCLAGAVGAGRRGVSPSRWADGWMPTGYPARSVRTTDAGVNILAG